MEGFVEFLEKRCQLLEKVSRHTKSLGKTQATRSTNKFKNNSSTLLHAAVTKGNCPLCQEEHALYLYKTFLDLPISKRIEQVKRRRICFNCLRLGHIAINKLCKLQKCRKCGKSHNTLLHLERGEDDKDCDEGQKSQSSNINDEAKETVATHVATETLVQRILPTAIVMITGKDGQAHRCNILLDSGSQSNFMTVDLRNKLGLHTIKADILVAGLNQSKTKVLETATVTIESLHTEFKERLGFLMVPKITFNLPSKPLNLKQINISTGALLADPDFHKPKKNGFIN